MKLSLKTLKLSHSTGAARVAEGSIVGNPLDTYQFRISITRALEQ